MLISIKILLNIIIAKFLINTKIIIVDFCSSYIETLKITRFYRICKICDILNKVLESRF